MKYLPSQTLKKNIYILFFFTKTFVIYTITETNNKYKLCLEHNIFNVMPNLPQNTF